MAQPATQIHRTVRAMAACVALGLGLAPVLTQAATFTVINTNDNGAGSFRQAILNANGAGGTNLIAFNLPGAGPFSISPQTALPVITNSVIIDAASQPGYAGTPLLELNGSAAGTNANGLCLAGGNSLVRGLAINRFQGFGIALDVAGGNVVQANYIGTDVSGTLNAGNGNAGIHIASFGNVIGGNGVAAGNLIAHNGAAGVAIISGTNNLVRANSILLNNGLALDLGAVGVEANDAGDADTGANNLQNYPVLTSINASGAGVAIRGHLSSTPNTTFQIDLYASPTLNATGAGESKSYLGSVFVTTDAGGNAAINAPLAVAILANSYVSATATDPANNTSEFSSGLQFIPVNPVAITVAVNASSAATMLGDQLSYSIVVTNSGTNAATGIVVTDPLPAGMRYVYSVASQGTATASSNDVTFNLGTLAPGVAAMMKIYVTPQSLGLWTNTVTVSQKEYNAGAADSGAFVVVNVYQPAPPTISKQPLAQILNLGGLLNLVVEALGPPGIKYQWRLNGANIPGATNSTYGVLSLLASDCGSYSVVVSDDFGATTSDAILVKLSGLLALPASDNFANRGPLLNVLGLVSYSNVGATSEPGEPLHAGVPGGKSVWFTWTPLLSGVATFDTAGSSFDTLLAVYTGNSLATLAPVASDDDSDGFYTSRVVFNAVAGTTYSIAVDGAYGAEGNIILNSSQQILTPSVPRITTQPADQIVGFGSTAVFSISTISGASYQWYSNDVSIAGATTSTLQINNVSNAQVAFYRVRATVGSKSTLSLPASLQISMLDGVVNVNAMALDKFQAASSVIAALFGGTQGHTVQVQKTSMASKGGAYSKASGGGGTSRGYSSTQVFSTYGGGSQSGEPNHCDQPGGSSAWTSVQAIDNGIMEIDTDGSNFPTILGVYTGNGNDFSSLTPVACDVSSGTGGTNSMVTFAATSNTVYYIAVDGVNGAYGTVVLNANLSVPPSITAQPAGHTVASGSTVVLTATVAGYPAPLCQWWCNGCVKSGATTNTTLTITNFQSAACGDYQLVALNNVGSAATDAACILLNGPMHLDQSGVNQTNRLFQMRLVGSANTNYVILASTNMTTWIPLATNASATGLWNFTDTHSTNFPGRFYRVKAQ